MKEAESHPPHTSGATGTRAGSHSQKAPKSQGLKFVQRLPPSRHPRQGALCGLRRGTPATPTRPTAAMLSRSTASVLDLRGATRIAPPDRRSSMTFNKVVPNVRQQCRHRNSTGRAAQSAATAHPAANIVLCPRARASPNRTDNHLHIFHRINVQVTGQRRLSAGSPTHDDNDFDRLTIVSCSGSQPSLQRRTRNWGLHRGLCTPCFSEVPSISWRRNPPRPRKQL